MSEEDTLLWYRHVGPICIEWHRDLTWGFGPKWWPSPSRLARLLSLGHLCLYWYRGR